ncbi:concanavalin A-like lectin/glucanase domain-containing protein [Rhizophagus clarus]|uniref:Concanavalin A-like lectin/glucanase domain-containing protein n=1 Tax=Rhizophagus clarus TaxID=94130 RepID=A0A8H3QF59_9GLOM|nr:concanavalin A-like lectin/glucanase domain-containing protein [Rhizophagus clarus]
MLKFESNKILTFIILVLLYLSPLVCGAPVRSSSYWVFWYYSNNGDRNCGNYCYLVFSLVGAILLCICGCGCLRCYFIKKQYKEERLESNINTQQILNQWEHDLQMSEQQQRETQQQIQYPPLSHTHNTINIPDDNIPPPSYNNNNTYNPELHKHALRQESNWSAYKAGKQFTRDNPPKEILPPHEHLNYIRELGGVKSWKFVPESSILQLNIASVTNDHILSFHAKLDAMMQTNYPLLDMEYSKLPSINNNNNNNNHSPVINNDSKKGNNHLSVNTTALNVNHNNESNVASTSSQPLPPSYTPQSFALQPPTDSWFFYYEVTILSNPNNDKTTIAIGLATKPYPTFRLTGCNSNSVGYHSDEGKKFHNDGLTGTKYAEKWGEIGDVIGCGYYPNTGQVFFTKNGKNLGIAYTGLFHVWFPTIGSDGICSLKVNFGQDEFIYRRANGMSVAGIIPQNIVNQGIEEENIEEGEIQ